MRGTVGSESMPLRAVCPKQPVTTDPFWADWCPRQRPVSAGPAINVCSPEARWRGRWRASDRVAGARDRPLSGSPTPTTAFRRVNREWERQRLN